MFFDGQAWTARFQAVLMVGILFVVALASVLIPA